MCQFLARMQATENPVLLGEKKIEEGSILLWHFFLVGPQQF